MHVKMYVYTHVYIPVGNMQIVTNVNMYCIYDICIYIYIYMHARKDRIWVWNRYGTAYRSIYTLYEPWIQQQQLPPAVFWKEARSFGRLKIQQLKLAMGEQVVFIFQKNLLWVVDLTASASI